MKTRPSSILYERSLAISRAIRPRRRGFTLIEVLITMLLLAVIIPVALRGASLAMAVASHARYSTEASMLAERQLNSLIAMNEWSTSPSGDFGPDYPLYRWECQYAEQDDGLAAVDFRVVWIEQQRERDIVLSTLVYQSDTTTATTTAGAP